MPGFFYAEASPGIALLIPAARITITRSSVTIRILVCTEGCQLV